MKANALAPAARPQAYSDVYPLDEFYGLRGETTPSIERLEPTDLPQPQRSLLAHQSDMTSTLENFYHRRLYVEVLARHTVDNEYCREVALRLDPSEQRVEFGAIKIMLDLLPDAARQEILRERQPVGRILTDAKVEFFSRPHLYFRITSDGFIDRALGLTGPHALYGRRNTLVDPWSRPLAEIVEILPPA
jgi:chorismate-pyruvate lyase